MMAFGIRTSSLPLKQPLLHDVASIIIARDTLLARKDSWKTLSIQTLIVNAVLEFMFYTESGSRYARGFSACNSTVGYRHAYLLHKCPE
jgi:hypothetical protein